MEVRKPVIKSIPYGEFKDNEGLEKLVAELHEGGTGVVLGTLDQVINWGRSNSLWSLTFATSCCGIEFMAVGCARYDFARFGFEVTRNSPRQADLIMCAGTITHKMAPVFKRLYDEMADPKYVVAVGGCAISGRCLHPRLPAAPGGHNVWHDAAAAQGEDREILRRGESQADRRGASRGNEAHRGDRRAEGLRPEGRQGRVI